MYLKLYNPPKAKNNLTFAITFKIFISTKTVMHILLCHIVYRELNRVCYDSGLLSSVEYMSSQSVRLKETKPKIKNIFKMKYFLLIFYQTTTKDIFK